MSSVVVLGLDPGLRTTGLVVVRSNGPSLPILLHRASVRLATYDKDNADRMARAVAERINGMTAIFGVRPDVWAVERFSHRPYLTTVDGRARRVRDASEMGRLCGRLVEALTNLGATVVEVDPDVSKRGFPAGQRFLAKMLPRPLRNIHERDAYLVANAAITLSKQGAAS